MGYYYIICVFYNVFDLYYCLEIFDLYVFIYVTLGYDAECMDEIFTPRGPRAHFKIAEYYCCLYYLTLMDLMDY
jgi:hypothetical protein